MVSTDSTENIGVLLNLSHFLKPKINLLTIQSDYLSLLPQEVSNIFLLDYDITNGPNLVARFKEDKTYSLRLIDPLSGLWQIEKLQKDKKF